MFTYICCWKNNKMPAVTNKMPAVTTADFVFVYLGTGRLIFHLFLNLTVTFYALLSLRWLLRSGRTCPWKTVSQWSKNMSFPPSDLCARIALIQLADGSFRNCEVMPTSTLCTGTWALRIRRIVASEWKIVTVNLTSLVWWVRRNIT